MTEGHSDSDVIFSESNQCNPMCILHQKLSEVVSELRTQAESDYSVISTCFQRKACGPRIHYKKKLITIDVAFQAAMWATAYGISVLFDKWVEICRQGKEPILCDSDSDVKDAFALLSYSTRLFQDWEDWPESLPCPPQSDENCTELVRTANKLYLVAIQFCIAHEFAHDKCGHGGEIYLTLNRNDSGDKAISMEIENDADRYAAAILLPPSDDQNSKTIQLLGMLTAQITPMFGCLETEKLNPETHPNWGTRIQNVLSQEPDDKNCLDTLIGVAILAFVYFLNGHNVDTSDLTELSPAEAIDKCLNKFDYLKDGRYGKAGVNPTGIDIQK